MLLNKGRCELKTPPLHKGRCELKPQWITTPKKKTFNSAYTHSNDKNPKTDILKEGEQPHLTPLKVKTEHDSRYFFSSQNNIKTVLNNFIKHVVYMHFYIKLIKQIIWSSLLIKQCIFAVFFSHLENALQSLNNINHPLIKNQNSVTRLRYLLSTILPSILFLNLYMSGGCSAMPPYMHKFNCVKANPNWFNTIPKKADFFSPLEWSLAISLSKEFESYCASQSCRTSHPSMLLYLQSCNAAGHILQ